MSQTPTIGALGYRIASVVCLAGACAGTSLAQGPTIQVRTLAHLQGASGPADSALPTAPGVTLIRGARTGPQTVVLSTSDSRVFVADGDAVREIMIAGTQIPGQTPGLVWRGRVEADFWPMTDGGSFAALASGPGIGDAPALVTFFGDLEHPFSVDVTRSRSVRTTRSGLRFVGSAIDWVRIATAAGSEVSLIPTSYVPTGATGPGTPSAARARLNNAGSVAMVLNAPTVIGTRPFALVADAQSIAVRAMGADFIQSDRGTIPTTTMLEIRSQPLSDGSIVLESQAVIANEYVPIVWISRPSGPASVIAMAGDRAPGTEPGVTFRPVGTFSVLAASPNGSVLLIAHLAGPGVTWENSSAAYLWRNGTLTLVARSEVRSLVDVQGRGGAALNENGDVALVTPTRARLFRPGVGTVSVARAGEAIHPSSGLSGVVQSVSCFAGPLYDFFHVSGGDDQTLSCLTQDGALVLFGTADAAFAAEFRVSGSGCPSDFNLDGFTDFFDYLDFVTCFEGGRCPDGKPADFNDDGIADFFDYTEFVEAFESGC